MHHPGIAEVVELLVSWAVSTAWCFAVVIADERDLDDDALGRAWPTSSRAAALVGLGFLALPFHFARTRGEWWPPALLARRLGGFVLGLGVATGAVVAASTVTEWLVRALAFVLGFDVE